MKKYGYPKGVVRVYSNPEFLDCYTVYYSRRVCSANFGMHPCLGMSGTPFDPQSICQHSEGVLGKHNGKRISFKDLPADCRKAVRMDLKPEKEMENHV